MYLKYKFEIQRYFAIKMLFFVAVALQGKVRMCVVCVLMCADVVWLGSGWRQPSESIRRAPRSWLSCTSRSGRAWIRRSPAAEVKSTSILCHDIRHRTSRVLRSTENGFVLLLTYLCTRKFCFVISGNGKSTRQPAERENGHCVCTTNFQRETSQSPTFSVGYLQFVCFVLFVY